MIIRKINITIAFATVLLLISIQLLAENPKWEEITGGTLGVILDVEGIDGTDSIYVGTKRGFYLRNRAGIWEKVLRMESGSDEEEFDNIDLGEEEKKDTGISIEGLPSSEAKSIIHTKKGIFAISNEQVFHYSSDENWQLFFTPPGLSDAAILKSYRDAESRDWLLVAAGKYVYKVSVDSAPERVTFSFKKDILPYEENAIEIPIQDVHAMAIEYAEVSPEKIKRWRHGAKWKALMPRLSVGFSKSIDDNIEIYKSASTSYVMSGPRETDDDWDIDLTWDLSDLVWNGAQTLIDVRSKLMVQLREDILEEVTRLYFERKRLISEIASLEKNNEKSEDRDHGRLLEKALRVEELTAYIDALTGGKFSETIRRSVEL